MVSGSISTTIDHGFGPQLSQTKDYEIGICCFSTKHTTFLSKSKDYLA